MNRKLEIQISKRKLSVLFFSLLLLKPDYIDQVPTLDYIFNAGRAMVFGLLLIMCIYRKMYISKVTAFILTMEFYIILNTIVQGGDVSSCLKSILAEIGIVLLSELYSDDMDNLIAAQLLCYELLIYINLATIILFPRGMYSVINRKNWLLGYYNGHVRFFIPAMIFAFLYQGRRKKVRRIILVGAIIMSSLLTWSGGSIATIGVLIVVYVIFKNKSDLMNYLTYWLIQPFFFLLIIINRKTNLIKWFVGDLLGKWSSISGRMLVWNIETNSIKHNLGFGCGVEYTYLRIKKYLGMGWAVHAHNFLLEILHQGGIVYMFFYLILILYVWKTIKPYKEERIIKVISLAFLGWAMRGTVDPCIHVTWSAFFVLAYKYVLQISRDEERSEKEISEKAGMNNNKEVLANA